MTSAQVNHEEEYAKVGSPHSQFKSLGLTLPYVGQTLISKSYRLHPT